MIAIYLWLLDTQNVNDSGFDLRLETEDNPSSTIAPCSFSSVSVISHMLGICYSFVTLLLVII